MGAQYPDLRSGTSLRRTQGKSQWSRSVPRARLDGVMTTIALAPPRIRRRRSRSRRGVAALRARTVQERLVAHGFLAGDAVTGRFDRHTLDAVARFQAAHGLA